jgi:hypothetical protein
MNHYRFQSINEMRIKAATNTNPDVEYRRARDTFFNNVEDYKVRHLVPRVKQRMLQRMNEGYWAGHAIGKQQIWQQKVVESTTDVCIVATLLSGSVAQLRKSILLVDSHLKRNEPGVTYQIHLYIRKHQTPFGELTSSSEALYPLFPVISQLHFEEPLASVADILDKATSDCKSSRHVLFLEDKWETIYFNSESNVLAKEKLLHTAPIFRQAMDLIKQEPDLLELWIGDTPNHVTYTNRTSWTALPKVSDPNWVKYYRKQYAYKSSGLGVTRLGGSLKSTARLARMPTWRSLDNKSKAFTYIPKQSLSISVQEKYAAHAHKLGFASAHFCLRKGKVAESGDNCNVDFDEFRSDDTTGIMWRQRIVMTDDAVKNKGLTDRP